MTKRKMYCVVVSIIHDDRRACHIAHCYLMHRRVPSIRSTHPLALLNNMLNEKQWTNPLVKPIAEEANSQTVSRTRIETPIEGS